MALDVLENTYSPTLVEFYSELGLDIVWIDLEHAGPSPWNANRLDDLLRAANSTETELLVRLPTPEPGLVRKALDAGVRNTFISHVETSEEVRRAVRAARFQYNGDAGERGLASPRASRWGLAEDYVETENEETLVGVTIEDLKAIENLNDILAVLGLGFVFIGPLDFSVAVGHPSELDHPDVQGASRRVYRSVDSASAWRT